MVSKIKTLVMGGLVAGSLALSAGSVFARDYWHWSEQQHAGIAERISEATIEI